MMIPELIKSKLRSIRDRILPYMQELKEYRSFISQLKLPFGNEMLPQNKVLERRWEESEGRRILFYADMDFSGSLFKWVEAINKNTNFAARLVTSQPHPYGYPLDILIPDYLPKSIRMRNTCYEAMYDKIHRLVAEANVVHFKEEAKLFIASPECKNDQISSIIEKEARNAKIPIVFTLCGSFARHHQNDVVYRSFIKTFNTVVSMTPDLCFDWIDKPLYIPHAIDTDKFTPTWKDGKLVTHSPSSKDKKGTEQFLEAVNLLKKFNFNIETDIITNTSFEECLRRKGESSLFFDQAGRSKTSNDQNSETIGWYGNSAIEAMAFGIPVIAHLSKKAFEGAKRAGNLAVLSCPVINVECEDVESIRKAIEDYFLLDTLDRRKLSNSTRAWAESFHSYKAVAKSLADVYCKLLR